MWVLVVCRQGERYVKDSTDDRLNEVDLEVGYQDRDFDRKSKTLFVVDDLEVYGPVRLRGIHHCGGFSRTYIV